MGGWIKGRGEENEFGGKSLKPNVVEEYAASETFAELGTITK